ncbi:protein phosphatase 2C domain-containing protein [Nocardiopsis sp. CNT312]|uniref:protein phosphatase 2C domain-containing protein n=1 Tax=Nocardiopsis sp. CNT312 TaxID=1137268 RepID=UPI00048E73C0|nr:protein phosphatase 2C domain-containing protein [Nocardiopsis sp. CNT312]
MPFRTASRPGRDDHPNEDFAAVGADCAVVLDGVTAPPGIDNGCSHGVAWFAQALGGRLLAGIETGLPLNGALAGAITGVAALHADTCDLTRQESPSVTVVAVRVRADVLEYLVLSDSVLLVEQGDGVRLVADTRLDDLRRRLAAEGGTVPVRTLRNVPGGFWTAGADPRAADEAVTGTLSPGRFAAMTDGAARAVEVFGACTWEEAFALVMTEGPDALVDLVRTLERADPEGRGHPRGKAHDDATVVTRSP